MKKVIYHENPKNSESSAHVKIARTIEKHILSGFQPQSHSAMRFFKEIEQIHLITVTN